MLTGSVVAAPLAIINSIGNLIGNFFGPHLRVWLKFNRPTFLMVAAACGLIAAIALPLLRLLVRQDEIEAES